MLVLKQLSMSEKCLRKLLEIDFELFNRYLIKFKIS